jgi:hypothetical protein
MRLVPRGWSAPCQIIHHLDRSWQAIIDGSPGVPSHDPVQAGVDRIWHSGTMIDEAEFRFLNATREWAKKHDPSHPAANAMLPIRPGLLKPITS